MHGCGGTSRRDEASPSRRRDERPRSCRPLPAERRRNLRRSAAASQPALRSMRGARTRRRMARAQAESYAPARGGVPSAMAPGPRRSRAWSSSRQALHGGNGCDGAQTRNRDPPHCVAQFALTCRRSLCEAAASPGPPLGCGPRRWQTRGAGRDSRANRPSRPPGAVRRHCSRTEPPWARAAVGRDRSVFDPRWLGELFISRSPLR
jgi:hypothetical protein